MKSHMDMQGMSRNWWQSTGAKNSKSNNNRHDWKGFLLLCVIAGQLIKIKN